MPTSIPVDLKQLSGEELLLLRIAWGEMVREDVDFELDRRAGLKPIPMAQFCPVAGRAMRRPVRVAA